MRKIKRITSFIVLTVLFAMTMFSGCGKQASSVTVADVNDAALEAESVQVTAESVSALSAEEYDMSKIDQTFLQDKEITNILIVGQDRREGEDKSVRTRSDTMIICSINRKTGEIGLSSLMRDLYVPISGYGATRINAAYVYGGMELLDQVILEDFGVVIDGNVEVDFEGFLTAISKLAPLDVELNAAEAEYMNTNFLDGTLDEGYLNGPLKEGVNSLSPGQLLEYARMRYVGNSDYERTERQRRLMKIAFKKAKESNVFTLLDFAASVLPTITTDISAPKLLGIIYTVLSNDMGIRDEEMRLPVNGLYESRSIRGMSVLVPDLAANAAELQRFIYGEVINPTVRSFAADELTDDAISDNIQPNEDEMEAYEEAEEQLEAEEVVSSSSQTDAGETTADSTDDSAVSASSLEPVIPEDPVSTSSETSTSSSTGDDGTIDDGSTSSSSVVSGSSFIDDGSSSTSMSYVDPGTSSEGMVGGGTDAAANGTSLTAVDSSAAGTSLGG